MTTVQPTESPASTALLRLLATDDKLPTDWQAVAVMNRPTCIVILVDTPEAWGRWVYAIGAASDLPNEIHRGLHLLTAENIVAGWPVQVVKSQPWPAERPHLVRAA